MTAPTITRPNTSAAHEPRTGTPLLAMPSEQLLYEARLRITGVTEYGVALADITAGTAPIPPEGIRLDFAFEGMISGPKLEGSDRNGRFRRGRDPRVVDRRHADTSEAERWIGSDLTPVARDNSVRPTPNGAERA